MPAPGRFGFVPGNAAERFPAPPLCPLTPRPPDTGSPFPSRPAPAAAPHFPDLESLRNVEPDARARLPKTPRSEQRHGQGWCQQPQSRCLAQTGCEFLKETPRTPGTRGALSLPQHHTPQRGTSDPRDNETWNHRCRGGTDPVTRAQAREETVDSSRAVIKDGIYYPKPVLPTPKLWQMLPHPAPVALPRRSGTGRKRVPNSRNKLYSWSSQE